MVSAFKLLTTFIILTTAPLANAEFAFVDSSASAPANKGFFDEEFSEDCLSYAKEFAKQQSLQVACDIAEITKKILEGNDVAVPAKLFHFGKKIHMLENAKVGNIPEEVWKDTIMGETGRRFNIKKLRRGLYGTHLIDTNFFYDSYAQDWMMEISVKEECRNPAKVASLDRLQDDKRFREWFEKTKRQMTLSEFSKKCSNTGSYEEVYFKAPVCQQIAEAFLKDQDIKIIQDHIVEKSFYIRDRACIEGIRAKPEDLVQIFADNPALWIKSCSIRYQSNALATILKRILLEEDLGTISENTLKQLEFNSKLLDAQTTTERTNLNKMIDSYIQARKDGSLSKWKKTKH